MKVKREICVAGSIIDFTVKVPSGNHVRKRSPKVNITKEKVQENNDRITTKTLARLINLNFGIGCYHEILTYRSKGCSLNDADPVTPEEALKEFKNFIARLRREMKKLGLELKWIMATEYENARIHHHFITNAPKELVNKKWNAGIVIDIEFYKDYPDREPLASYIVKETSKSFRDSDSPFKSRYSHSRNLITPEVRVEFVEPKVLFEEPVAWKGYYIPPESVRRYEHPITGLEHLEYKMISLDIEPRLKKYYKGKKKKSKENYSLYINYAEEQQSLFNRLC
ncbi:MAG: hypothetical protein RSA49_05145 [Anaerovoracaceae bacterium]